CLLPTPMGRDLQGCPWRNSPRQAQRRLLRRIGEISSSASDSPRAAIYRTINDQLTLTDKFPRADVSVLQPVSCGADIHCFSQIFEILTPAPCAHRTGRSRIVSLCGKV